MATIDDLKKSQGFRQYDPGIYTNDASHAQGMGYTLDQSNPLGYKQISYNDWFGKPSTPQTTTTQPQIQTSAPAASTPTTTASAPKDPYAGLPGSPQAPTNTNYPGGSPTFNEKLTGSPASTQPPPGYYTDPTTGAWVWGAVPGTQQQTIDTSKPFGPAAPPTGGTNTQPNPVGYSVGQTTYAGFEPSSYGRNVGTTDPSAGAKDWVYRYLLDNHVAPSNSWAPAAAQALNQQFGTNVFTAKDGETLAYGDEYVHSAPNGYGLTGGQYDPNAQGEFFWGTTGGPSQSGGAPDGTIARPGQMSGIDASGQAGAGPRTLPGYQALSPTQTGTAQEAITYLNGISHSLGGGDLSQAELAQYAQLVGYKEGQPVTGDMANKIVAAMMQAKGYAAPGGGGPTTGTGSGAPAPTGGTNLPPTGVNPGGSYTPTNPFDDPATKNYIDLLNTRIQDLLKPRQDPSLDAFTKMIQDRTNGLNTPYTNPDAAPLQDWMRQYFAQLQGPTYTPAQQATIQTQALDPMERQRQAELQKVAVTMGSRGITPGSGPYLQAERDINAKYDQFRAQTQSGLAVNEINQGRQNQAQAANVGGQLAQFTQGQFANNENRANEAVSLFGSIPQLNLQEFNTQQGRANQAVTLGRQIPDMAQSRLQTAINLLNGSNVNPASLMTSLQGFQQQGINQNTQDNQFWSTLFANIAKNFGL